MTLAEYSPAYLWAEFAIPADADYLSFDFKWENVGDGDYLTLHFADFQLYTFIGREFSGSEFWNSGPIFLGDIAGMTGQLLFSLNSVGNPNASFTIRNLELHDLTDVPLPGGGWLLLTGLAGIWLIGCRRRNG